MSVTEGLHKGMVIRHEGQLYTVLDFHGSQKGKQKATVHVKLRAISTGHTGERTLDELGKIEEVSTEIRHMQYLYADRTDCIFMDVESYEQYPLSGEVLGDAVSFLVEEETYSVMTIEGQPVSLRLPPIIVMEVVDTAAPQHSGGGSNVSKDAKLSNGLVIHVPLFIKNGDRIRVKTEDREYQGKEQ